MSTITTTVGRAYAITPTSNCTVSTPGGVIICSIKAGVQAMIIAPCDSIIVSDDNALVTMAFKGAALSASGGGASSNLPIGTILASACAAMEDYLLCNGSAVSRAEYEKLFAAIGTTYGAGDGSSTFNLPDLRNRALWGASTTHPLGKVIAPGLPNISGYLTAYSYAAGGGSGAFASSINVSNRLASGTASNFNHINVTFQASKSNSIYGASNTVQPPALAVNFFIKHSS